MSINKTAVNLLTKDKKFITSYASEIVNSIIVGLVNHIVNYVNLLINEKSLIDDFSFFNYVMIELSYDKKEIGIKFVFQKTLPHNITQILTNIYDSLIIRQYNIVIFCYEPSHGVSERLYLTDGRFFNDQYDDIQWYHQIDSFVQGTQSSTIHNIVNDWIGRSESSNNFFGMGGEMGYYAKKNKSLFDQIYLLSSSRFIIDDCIRNFDGTDSKIHIQQINYDTFKIKDVIEIDLSKTYVALLNLRITGLGVQLATQFLEKSFDQVIYIGCDQKFIDIDLSVLLGQYEIVEKLIVEKVILIYLRRTSMITHISNVSSMDTYVSLGSSCSVAEQLNRHKLRKEAYPFDWLRTEKFSSVVECLKDNFKGFMELNQKTSDNDCKFPLSYDDNFPTETTEFSSKMENPYGFKFMHDYNSSIIISKQHMEVTDKYRRRIERFTNLKGHLQRIIFIRDELKPNTLEGKDIHEFISYLKELKINYIVIFIIHNPKNKELPILQVKLENVYLINDTLKFTDWQRTNLDWPAILNLDFISQKI